MTEELRKRAKTEFEVHVTADGYIRFYSKIYILTN